MIKQKAIEKIWEALQRAGKQSHQQPALSSRPHIFHSSHLTVDTTYQHVSDEDLNLLFQLAEARSLHNKIEDLFLGQPVNTSQNKPALHTSLRETPSANIKVNGLNIATQVEAAKQQIKQVAEDVRNGRWLGRSGHTIKHIVNIGIGGSDLGVKFCLSALSSFASTKLSYHFVSDINPNSFEKSVHTLSPESTLFIVASKSFTTQETLINWKKAVEWMGGPEKAQNHFIAVTANTHLAKRLGFSHVLPIWDWIGGRFSFFSAINLLSAIALGYENFEKLLKGARTMDKHFRETPFEANLPVLLALLGVWNINFLAKNSHLLLVYANELKLLVPFIQQLDMESCGKSCDRAGNPIQYQTGPVVWGGLGNHAQHSFYQHLCQGTHSLAADFITVASHQDEPINQMAESKIRTLSKGMKVPNNPNSSIRGQLPINHIQLNAITPEAIGELVALYEHKTYVQSVLWNINAFDQPGVESAKSNLAQASVDE